MPTSEQIQANIKGDIQVVIKAPHYVKDQGRIYWSSKFVDSELVGSIINLCESGNRIQDQKKAERENVIREQDETIANLNKRITELSEVNAGLKSRLEDTTSNIEKLASSANSVYK